MIVELDAEDFTLYTLHSDAQRVGGTFVQREIEMDCYCAGGLQVELLQLVA